MGELIGSDGDFEYRVMNPDISEEACMLASQIFATREPMAAYKGISVEVFLEFTRILFNQPNAQGMSLVAIHRPTNELCGAFLCERHVPGQMPDFSAEVISAFSDVYLVTNALTEEMYDQYNIDPNSLLYQGMLVAVEKWKGNNIGYNLMKFSLDVAKRHGLRFAVVELSSPISQRICVGKLGYTMTREIVYRDFEVDGRKPFENLDGSAKAAFIQIN